MRYAYEDISDVQFEDLVISLCKLLFGVSVQGFAIGTDGGRDAKFVGTAEIFPSKSKPWVGRTIIQAKHVNTYNRSCSECDFFGINKSNTVIGKEIPRIRKLREGKLLDNYILFSNRRLTAKTEEDIRQTISEECDIPYQSIYLCGVEQLEAWLKQFPEAAERADIDPIDSPLIVSSDDLAEIVQIISKNMSLLCNVPDDIPERVLYADKNKLNNMSAEYAAAQRAKYLKETAQIKTFLAAPENFKFLKMYEAITDDFQLKILSKRKSYQAFDEVMEYLVELLSGRDPVLRQKEHRRLTRAILFYMYWNCDIGVSSDASSK